MIQKYKDFWGVRRPDTCDLSSYSPDCGRLARYRLGGKSEDLRQWILQSTSRVEAYEHLFQS